MRSGGRLRLVMASLKEEVDGAVIRIAMSVKLKKESIEEYRECQRNVWPEVEETIRKLGFRNLSIFLSGETLFLYQEYDGPEPVEDAFAKYVMNEKCRKWEELIGKYQAASPNALPGLRWTQMEEIYHLEK